jgi:hypothetical protein
MEYEIQEPTSSSDTKRAWASRSVPKETPRISF